MADSLKAFLAENAIKMAEVNYIASKRFVDGGKPIAWRIKPINGEENEKILERCRKKSFVPGTRETQVTTDNMAYGAELICACVVYPDLNDAGLQDSYGAIGAAELVKKMLTPAEYADLLLAVQEANGFETGMDKKVKRAKN